MASWGRASDWLGGSDATSSGSSPLDGTLGDFRVLGELGRGGMGTVYEAEQISMGRRVALKVLPFAALAQQNALQRFRNEVRAAAALDHPHIVSVYSVGEERGIHYYAMQLVCGQSLANLILQLRRDLQHDGDEARADAPTIDSTSVKAATDTTRLARAQVSTARDSRREVESCHSAARMGIQVAEALQHAHEQGVLHRDIKPGNLLLDGNGKLYVTDFGLARIEADAGLTMTGDLIGTLRYMSPEQALGTRVVIDHRADIYSLGATLYELLTLQPAFGGTDRSELLRQIAFEEPTPLRKLNRHIPTELETIVLNAMAKEPDERYHTAQELADDLRAYLDDRPIKAKPPTLLQLMGKWTRRHVGAVWTAVVAALSLSAVLAGATALIGESRQAAIADRERAEMERNTAVDQRNEALLQQYYAEIVSGQTDLAEGNLPRLQQKLTRHLPVGSELDRRNWEWYYLFSHCHPEVMRLFNPAKLVFASWSPDGELIATAGMIWKPDTGECVRAFTPSFNLWEANAWSPDSQTLAWGQSSDDGGIYLWDRQTDELRELRENNGASVWALDFNHDGTRLASGSLDDTIRIWDPFTGEIVRRYSVDAHVTDTAWSPDGKLLAAGARHHLYIWDVESGEEVLHTTEDDYPNRMRLSWNPNGKRLAVNTSARWYVLSRGDGWKKTAEQPHRFEDLSLSEQSDVAWNPTDNRLAIGNRSTVSIWDASGSEKLQTLSGHVGVVNSVAWSPDGNRLVTTDDRRELRVWDLTQPPQPPPIETGSRLARIAWASPGSTLQTTAHKDGETSLWSVDDGKQLESNGLPAEDGQDIGTFSYDNRFRAYIPSATPRNTLNVVTRSGAIHAVWKSSGTLEPIRYAWSLDNKKLALITRSEDRLALDIWNVDTEETIAHWERYRDSRADNNDFLFGPAWSPDGSKIAIVAHGDPGDNGNVFWSSHIHIFDTSTGRRILKRPFGDRPRHGGNIRALNWSPDGRYLAQGTTEGLIEIISVGGQTDAVLSKAHDAPILALDWHRSGERIATAAADGAVKILEPKQGYELLRLRTSGGPCSLVAWSPNGRRLAVANQSGRIQVWDSSRGQEFAKGGSRHSELAREYYSRADTLEESQREDYLRKVVETAPQTLDYRLLRGQAFAELGDFDAAAREFSAATPTQIERGLMAARCHAYALLGGRDMERFRELHADLAKAIGDDEVDSKRFQTAWLGALIPDTTMGFDALVNDLAKQIKEQRNFERGNWEIMLLGAMQHRLGRYDDANDTLTTLRSKYNGASDSTDRYVLACIDYFLAMNRHQLGHSFQAQRLLSEAHDLRVGLVHENASWQIQVTLDTLQREAQRLIDVEESTITAD
nr:protein kinase [Aeoliella straminimaris]